MVTSSSFPDVDGRPATSADGQPAVRSASYQARIVLTDVATIVGAVTVSFLIRFDTPTEILSVGRRQFDYTVVTALIGLGWAAALAVGGVWDSRTLGRGTTEFRRLVRATVFFFGAVGVLAYLLKADLARGYLALALPFGLLCLLSSHLLWRRWLVRRHRAGQMLTDVLVVGSAAGAQYLGRRLQMSADSGYRVLGVCAPDAGVSTVDPTFPVVCAPDQVAAAARRLGAQAVAVASSDSFGSAEVRALAWELEDTGVRVLLSPSLVDVAGPRIHIRQVAGLPLMQVEEPRFAGPKLLTKTGLDVVAAAVGLLLLSPLFLLVAVGIKLSDGGPVFFRQARVGLGGSTFLMWKFRSMHQDAELRLVHLQSRSEGNAVLFKMRDDPRVTSIGRVLRRFSIDELPQLANVLSGSMSLVGPRPPLAREVALYSTDVHRRFLVKPGLTGLWQVSGRSDLTWDASVRLDLYYVENWSLLGDLHILAKTARAVFRTTGAY